jgi:predicted PurR-regulated permease PerM
VAASPGSDNALDGLFEQSGAEPKDVMAAAAEEASVTHDHAYGEPGRPFDRRTPFWVAMVATFGVALAAVGLYILYDARSILLLLGLALFIAAGLDPVVAWLHKWMPRPLAVTIVIIGGALVSAGAGDLIVPVLVTQITNLVNHLPHYFHEINNRSSFLAKLNRKYKIESNLKTALTKSSSSIATGVIGFGRAVIGALASTLIVVVVSMYLLYDLPRFKRLLYGLTPRSRRARTVVLGEEIFAKVGGYVLGNVIISVITGVGTWIWALAFGIPYPLLLAVVVAILDLLPVVGSTIGGVIVALVALTVSIPVTIATIAFYIVYRFVEDYLLSPRIMRRTVDVPGLVTVIATLIGGVLLGIIGALIAIPVAAAIKLLIDQVVAPRLERS